MQLWSRLCGSFRFGRRGEESLSGAAISVPETSLAFQVDKITSPAEEFASGTIALDGYGLEVPITESSDVQTDVEVVPWYTIPGFLDFLKQRRHRLRLRLARKDQPSIQERTVAPLELNHDVSGPPQPPVETLETDDDADSSEAQTYESLEGVNRGELDCPDLPLSTSGHGSTMEVQEYAGREADVEVGKVGLGGMFLAEEHTSTKIEPDPRSDSVTADRTSVIDTFETGGGPRTGSQPETVPGSTHATINESADTSSETESTRSTGRRPIAPGKEASDDFCVSAGMIKNVTGEKKSEKLFYDTGSPDSWVSQLLVTKYDLPTRPIRPKDLMVYDTIGGESVIPTDYADIWVADEHHGINEFTKVTFNITKSLGGRGLLLGRAFMRKHGVMLDAKQGPGVYVTTARNASEAAKEQQRLLLEQREEDRVRAQKIAASTAGSTTTGTGVSVVEKPVPSSRTSTSSGASKSQPPPKYS